MYENREKYAEELVQAFEEGRVRRGGTARRLAEAKLSSALTIKIEDAWNATLLAEKKGMEVHAYLADLIHKALKQEMEHAA